MLKFAGVFKEKTIAASNEPLICYWYLMENFETNIRFQCHSASQAEENIIFSSTNIYS